MKILIVFNHPAPYKVKLFNELSKSVDVDVIFERKEAKNRTKDFYQFNKYEFNCIDLKLHPIGKENAFGYKLTRYIKKYHKDYDYIIMNGYSQLAEISAIKYMHRNNIPYVLMINGGVIRPDNRFKFNYKKKLISGASLYFSPNLQSNEYLTHYGADPEKIRLFTYSNVLEKEVYPTPLQDEVRKQICIKYHLPYGSIFVNPAQFVERKNNEQLLEIFKGRRESLLLIGNGPLKKKYESYIKANNMDNVFIMNYVNEKQIREIMHCCTALITLSKEDIFGHTIVESLSCGTPVISSSYVVSALDTIKNDVNGYIVNIEKEDEIIEAINKIGSLKYDDVVGSIIGHTVEQSAIDILKVLK